MVAWVLEVEEEEVVVMNQAGEEGVIAEQGELRMCRAEKN